MPRQRQELALALLFYILSSHGVAAFTEASGTINSIAFIAGHRRTAAAAESRISTRPSTLFGSNADLAEEENQRNNPGANKKIVLIRHGCTHMNEYLSVPGTRWGDANFTDIFDESSEQYDLFRDSPLSPRGVRQAQRLSAKLGHSLKGSPGADIDSSLGPRDENVINEIELIACSPLSRALQTVEQALLPHIEPLAPSSQDTSSSAPQKLLDGTSLPPKRHVPVVALPLGRERVYLISDHGRPVSELSMQFPFCDFESEIDKTKGDSWWLVPKDPNSNDEDYVEWRPNGEGQTYACLGELEVDFNQRMTDLYDWLSARPESTIGLVSHWGVIDWLIGEDFENCEMRVVDFDCMNRTGFMLSDAEAAEIFSQGERCVVRDTD
mmetsp:Transcript_3642/g.7922  ORF Transcript_3642/g.7922 Transcript_3642/m.7922 type:complete len:382 (+) Transcript_3642:154-1299(+)